MKLLSGKKLFEKIKQKLRKEVESLIEGGGRPPHLVAVLVGDNPSSHTYVNAKAKACTEIGFLSTVINFSE